MEDYMKKNYLILIGIIILLTSCTNLNNSTEKENAIPENQGLLSFTINNETERSALPLSFVNKKVKFYTVYVYNNDKDYKAVFNSNSDEKSMALDAGKYNLVIIGSLYSASKGAIGSGSCIDVVINENHKTTVNITMKPFEMSIEAPDSAYCDEDFEVSGSFNSRNDYLYATNLRLCRNTTINETVTEVNWMKNIKNTNKESVFSACATLTAPGVVDKGTGTISVNASDIYIKDTTYSYTKNTEFNTSYDAYATEINGIIWKNITYVEPEGSGINVGVTWEQ